MKKLLLSIILLCGGMLTGCVQLVDMSEEESNIIAEYTAGSYLQQTNYKENLIYPKEEVAANQTTKDEKTTVNSEKNATVNATKSLTNSEDKTLEVNVVDSGLKNTTNSSQNTTSSNKDSNSTKESNSTKNDTVTKELSINDIVNYKNFSIQYLNYKVLNSYQSKMNGTYFNLEPDTGSKLLVVHFNIKNISDKTGEFNLIGKQLQYKLSDSNKDYLPMLTLLNEDLQYIDITIKPGKTYNAVIVFEVPKNIDKSKISLNVSKNTKTANIVMN